MWKWQVIQIGRGVLAEGTARTKGAAQDSAEGQKILSAMMGAPKDDLVVEVENTSRHR